MGIMPHAVITTSTHQIRTEFADVLIYDDLLIRVSPSFHSGNGEGAIDKTTFVEPAHPTVIGDVVNFQLGKFRAQGFHEALDICQSFSGWVRLAVNLLHHVLITFLKSGGT